LGTEPTSAKKEYRGQVLDVARFLLAEGRSEDLLELLAKLVARNSELERLLAQVRSGGKSREGVSSAQLLLLLDGIDEPAREAPPKPRRQPPLRKPLPPHLRRVDNLLAVPETERACPRCGAARACIGHEVTEVLDLIPAEVIVRVDRREKLACETCESELERAPAGDKVVSGGRMGTALVGQIIVDKYWDGLPLHRQKKRFERLGVKLAVSTLADQVTWATDLLRPLWRSARAMVLASEVMHLDGTSLPVLDEDTPGGIRLGSLWGYVGADPGRLTALYLYNSTGKKQGQREGELGPEDMLGLRNGYTVADASSLFEASFQRAGLIECGCNMHARRYFTKALDAGDARAPW
jgi:transposase